MDIKIKFISCSCHAHALNLVYDDEDNLYYLSIWKPCDSGKLYWSDRIKHAFRAIFKGEPFSEEVILTGKEANELIAFLKKNNGELQKKEFDKLFKK